MHADKKAAAGQDNALYTAHKVHTLAQIVFQRLAGSWTNHAPWAGPTGFVVPQPYGAMPGYGVTQAVPARPDAGGPATHGTHPPALFYWYP